jgi:hypothetical protein
MKTAIKKLVLIAAAIVLTSALVTVCAVDNAPIVNVTPAHDPFLVGEFLSFRIKVQAPTDRAILVISQASMANPEAVSLRIVDERGAEIQDAKASDLMYPFSPLRQEELKAGHSMVLTCDTLFSLPRPGVYMAKLSMRLFGDPPTAIEIPIQCRKVEARDVLTSALIKFPGDLRVGIGPSCHTLASIKSNNAAVLLLMDTIESPGAVFRLLDLGPDGKFIAVPKKAENVLREEIWISYSLQSDLRFARITRYGEILENRSMVESGESK